MERADEHSEHIGVAAAGALFAPRFEEASGEQLCVAYFGAGGELIDLRVHHSESIGQIDFPVREIIASALVLGTAALILAHNHPSGDPMPSAADIEATRVLIQVARPLGLVVRDHLVFGGGAITSFRARGLL